MKITLESGVDQTLSVVGHNFMYRSGEGDIRVVLMQNDSSVIHEEVLKVGQDLVGSPERFEKVRILNLHDSEQEIDFSTGSMQLVDTSDGSIVSIASARDVEVSSLPPVVVSQVPDNPQKYFGSINQVSVFERSQGVNTYVEPLDNENGIIVYLASTAVAIGSSMAATIVFNTSAPVNYLDGHHLSSTNTSAGGVYSNSLGFPLFIPAGFGLYSFLSASLCNATIVYEVL
jgi:hypothetical protein